MTKESDSSFAEAHRGILSEPTHMEGEDEDQEDEVEDERDCEECRMESRREVRTNTAHETWMTRCGQPLEPMSCETIRVQTWRNARM